MNLKNIHIRQSPRLIPATDRAATAQKHGFIDLVKIIIQSNYHNADFGMVELARLMKVSATQLNRKVSELAGCAPAKLILTHRLNRACHLLLNSDEPIKNIAWLSGFHAHASFCRCFIKAYNMSPSDYREAKGRATGLQASWAMPINMLDAENLLNYAAQHNWFRQILVFALSEKHNHSASIPQLSELTNTTPSTLNRKVKELYHITAARLIRDLRLQYACELLCSSVTITEAALTAGFFDHAHFCHCFKNAFATFPKSVRKEDKHEMPVTWLKNKLLEEIVK